MTKVNAQIKNVSKRIMTYADDLEHSPPNTGIDVVIDYFRLYVAAQALQECSITVIEKTMAGSGPPAPGLHQVIHDEVKWMRTAFEAADDTIKKITKELKLAGGIK